MRGVATARQIYGKQLPNRLAFSRGGCNECRRPFLHKLLFATAFFRCIADFAFERVA
jgi:hypothetical protein